MVNPVNEEKNTTKSKTTVRKPKGHKSGDEKYDGGGHNTAPVRPA